MPDGPLPPDVEIARLEQASCQESSSQSRRLNLEADV